MSFFRAACLTITLFSTLVFAQVAAADWRPPVDANDQPVTPSAPFIDASMLPDGTVQLASGVRGTSFTGQVDVSRYHAFTAGEDEYEGTFGHYLDISHLQTQEFHGAVMHLAIDTDDAGNSVAAWTTDCDAEFGFHTCVRAALRPAGGAWGAAQTVSGATGYVGQYSAVFAAIEAGSAVVAYSSDESAGFESGSRAFAARASIGGVWGEPEDLLGVDVSNDTDSGSRHVQGLAIDETGAAWVVINHYADSAVYVARAASRMSPWTLQRVDLDVSGVVEVNGKATIAFGGPTGVVAWREYTSPAPNEYFVATATCSVQTGTCSSARRASGAGTYATNPDVAVDDDGNAFVTWLQRGSGGGLLSLVGAYGELQDADLAWGDVETVMAATTAPAAGLVEDSNAGYRYVDTGFAADGTLFAAWQWSVPDEGTQSTYVGTRDGGADGAWVTHAVNAAPLPYYGTIPSLEVLTDHGRDAAVVWPRYTETGIRASVLPYDVTGPTVTLPNSGAVITAGQVVTLGASVRDAWSAVDDDDVEWSFAFNGKTAASTGRTTSGCFVEPGVVTASVIATDAAGNPSVEESFTFTVEGTAATCDQDPPGDGTGGTGGTGHDGSGSGTGTGTGTGTGAGGGTGTTGTGSTPTQETRPAPQPFALTSTVSRDKVPNVVGLNASTARDRFDRAGIEADFQVKMINRATAPKGITIGEVIAQTPRAGSMVTSAIRDAEPVRLDVYAGPAVGKATKTGCAVARVSAATKGLDLDLAKLVLKSMKCPYQVDVKPAAKGDDATVTGATSSKGIIHLGVSVPRTPTNNDLYLNVRENPNGISFERSDWTLTAGQANAFTVQVVDRAFRLAVKANVTVDMSDVGGARDWVGHTGAQGETPVVITPVRAGLIDVLVELPGADGQSLWGYAQLKVVDRSKAKPGTKLGTVAGRVFQKNAYGTWTYVPGGTLVPNQRNARFLGLDSLLSAMQQLVAPLGDAIRTAFAAKPVNAEQTLSNALTKVKVAPAQLNLSNSLISGKLGLGTMQPGQVVSAGGANVVAAGGANVIAAGGANVVSAGGGNVVAAGGGNVIAAGGGNLLTAGGAGVIAAGGGNVVAAGGGNVIAAGGGNVIAAGGGNVIAAGGGN